MLTCISSGVVYNFISNYMPRNLLLRSPLSHDGVATRRILGNVRPRPATSAAINLIVSLLMMQLLHKFLRSVAVLSHRSVLRLSLNIGLKLNQMKGSDHVPGCFPQREI
jgi:hypothetical protein